MWRNWSERRLGEETGTQQTSSREIMLRVADFSEEEFCTILSTCY
jgi:hypothetical protein